MEERDKISNLMNRIVKNSDSLHISRVPKKTRDAFIALANEEYAGDYGMLLCMLMAGVVKANEIDLILQVEELTERVTQLEARASSSANINSEDKKTIKTLNGKEIKR